MKNDMIKFEERRQDPTASIQAMVYTLDDHLINLLLQL